MFQFNRKQLASIGERSLQARLAGYLVRHFPQVRSAPAGQFGRELGELLAESRRHGLRSQRASALYVLANMVAGRETVARDPAVRQILAARGRPLADRALLLQIWLTRAGAGLQRMSPP